eukprot:CAMPEP_0204176296 /NCGR_PEP_ID=MMETSP0361-20130328/47492_1 /ASSEMBLY_ACC=CAM_ASM_000343 /TAXON_ID=268821 /ORGANISM="Scrippsiella Hangoei, Strain SHTV-5" /LENGTH=31 /DNA_ID= /DNA_START= /DNA_END= /DNA_ORIENTATION=
MGWLHEAVASALAHAPRGASTREPTPTPSCA